MDLPMLIQIEFSGSTHKDEEGTKSLVLEEDNSLDRKTMMVE